MKDDINLYNSKYKELEGKANNLTETVSESIKSLSTLINNMKERKCEWNLWAIWKHN